MRGSNAEEVLRVRVYTRSSRPRVDPADDGSYRIFVSSAPERGKANRELLKAMAVHLGVRKSEIRIIRGEKSRNKLIKVERQV